MIKIGDEVTVINLPDGFSSARRAGVKVGDKMAVRSVDANGFSFYVNKHGFFLASNMVELYVVPEPITADALEAENEQLKARVEELENLVEKVYQQIYDNPALDDIVEVTLNHTPAQSLLLHDAEVLEELSNMLSREHFSRWGDGSGEVLVVVKSLICSRTEKLRQQAGEG